MLMLLHSMVICKLCFAIHFCHYVRLFHWKPFFSLPYPFLNPSPYTHMGWHQQEDYISKQEQTKKTDTNLRSFELCNCLNSKQDIFDVIIHVQHCATATSCYMYALPMHFFASIILFRDKLRESQVLCIALFLVPNPSAHMNWLAVRILGKSFC